MALAPRITVVDDEEALCALLRYNLEAEGYNVETILHGDEADIAIRERVPDLLILDWMLPGLSGIELCRQLRARRETANLPIIMLTARRHESERLRGLATGADDYVTKPFSMLELLARIRAILRRSRPSLLSHVLNVGDITLDRQRRQVFRMKREMRMGPMEFRLLEYLMQSPGRVFTRMQLLDSLWGPDVFIDERTVDVHVGRLRKAINVEPFADPIRTVRGIGYSIG